MRDDQKDQGLGNGDPSHFSNLPMSSDLATKNVSHFMPYIFETVYFSLQIYRMNKPEGQHGQVIVTLLLNQKVSTCLLSSMGAQFMSGVSPLEMEFKLEHLCCATEFCIWVFKLLFGV